MLTKRFWAPLSAGSIDRRQGQRQSTDFYGVEVAADGRYLRRIHNVSEDGLLLVNPLGDERPGQIIELELPQRSPAQAVNRIKFEVVYVADGGRVGVRRLDSAQPLQVNQLGGPISL